MNSDTLARFEAKVERIPFSTCWVWLGATSRGYGQLKSEDRCVRYAHRLSYEHYVGPIPSGLYLDHLCRNRICVNPAHLEPVTTDENIRRGVSPSAQNARKTHCKRGHPFDATNTYKVASRRGRVCRICQLMLLRRWQARQRATQ